MKYFLKYSIFFLNILSFFLTLTFHADLSLVFPFFDNYEEFDPLFFMIPLLCFSVFSFFYFEKLSIYFKVFISLIKLLIPGSLLTLYFIIRKLKITKKDSYDFYDLLSINAKFNFEERLDYLLLLLDNAGLSIENYPNLYNICLFAANKFKKMSQIEDYANFLIDKFSTPDLILIKEKSLFERFTCVISSQEFLFFVASAVVVTCIFLFIYEYQTTKQNYLCNATEESIKEAGVIQQSHTAEWLQEAEVDFDIATNQIQVAAVMQGKEEGYTGKILNDFVKYVTKKPLDIIDEQYLIAKQEAFRKGHTAFLDHLRYKQAEIKNLNFKDTCLEAGKTIYKTISSWFTV